MVRKVSIWVMLVGILWLPASALGVPSEPTRTPCEFVAQVLVEIKKSSLAWIDAHCSGEKSVG